ncbi:hypothetical protein BH23GEM2_BH23GEM2_18790 [soil metagenome]
MTRGSSEAWLAQPLRRFVDETGVQLAVVMRPTGQVVGQHGFTRAVDVMSACSLGAAIHASSEELGRLVNARPFADLYHAGHARQIFLGRCESPRGRFLLLAIFDQASSIGLVQLFFEEFRRAVAAAAENTPPATAVFGEDFDLALARSLDALFAEPPRAAGEGNDAR